LWAFGNLLRVALFDTGVIAYAPQSDSTNWTLIWHQAVQLAIWIVLAALWLAFAVRLLRTAVIEQD